ncbi:putative endoglucanase [Rubripirellula tenax]|uniref:Putative endoglucanase n=1 Tax=Rubripirellula tenax TaxID=2528015 RepID=A0A5C6F0X5_9BACT|nr:DUF5060 domain-containing protein [Rubripirellula tenax]TWU54685.1 putative endoglucanase [Rubripirellula tenax]
MRLHHFRSLLAFVVVPFALTFINSVASAVETVQHRTGEVASAHQWEVIDIGFQVETVASQPVDVKFSATFTNDSGDRLEVPGFFDGNKDYVIRFTSSFAGRWSYVTHSDVGELDGKTGGIDVAAAQQGRNGGVVIDPNAARQFRYENGTSYYPIAFECDWLFALDAENATDIPNTRSFVDSLAKDGFNQIVMNVFAYDVNWKKDERLRPEHEYGHPKVFPFGGNNNSPDHSQINVDYFKRLDRVIEYLDQKGIVAHLMIYVWNKEVNWPAANSDADNRYFDYVVRRYQAYPNIVWDVSKEALGYGHTDVNYIHQRIERLRQGDAFKRLITVHDYSYCNRFQENVDFVSVQLWSSELYSVMRNVCERIPGKPILNIEHGGYEKGPYVVFTGNYTSPEVCLERAWQCVFAGTYPTHYWQGAAWNAIIADIESLAPEDRPRLDYYRHMRAFVDKYDVGRLKAGDKMSNAGFCLHNGDQLYVYYVPKECDFIGIKLPKELMGRTMRGTWFNPFDGTYDNPVDKEIVQWPAFEVPIGEGFRILVLKFQPTVQVE